MKTKFEKTGLFSVHTGRGRKPVSVAENGAEIVDTSRPTVQNNMRSNLQYYPCKRQIVQKLLPNDFEIGHRFSLQHLTSLEVDTKWP